MKVLSGVRMGLKGFQKNFKRFSEDFRRVLRGILSGRKISGPLRKVGSMGKEVHVGK